MDVVCDRRAGLDIHKKLVVACVNVGGVRETRRFGTVTEDLEALRTWLHKRGCSHVAMESTGA